MSDRNDANDVTVPPSPLDEAIAGYLLAVESGQRPDREAWAARHPDVADGLRAYFADQDRFDRAAGPLRDAMATVGVDADGATSDVAAAAGLAAGPVRYFGDYQLLGEIDRGGMGV